MLTSEVEIALVVEQEFEGSGASTARAASTRRAPVHRRIFSVTATDPLRAASDGALDRALALAEVDDGAVVIAEDLELDVTRPLDVFSM